MKRFNGSRGMRSVLLSAGFLWKLSPRATAFGLKAFQFYFGTRNGKRVLAEEKVSLVSLISNVIRNHAHSSLPFCLWYFCCSVGALVGYVHDANSYYCALLLDKLSLILYKGETQAMKGC